MSAIRGKFVDELPASSEDYTPLYTDRLLAEVPEFVGDFFQWLKAESSDGEEIPAEAVAAHLAEIPDPDEDMRLLWGDGPMPARLDWMMHSTQLEAALEYRAWEKHVAAAFKQAQVLEDRLKSTAVMGLERSRLQDDLRRLYDRDDRLRGKHPRAFVLDWGRRTGKDAFSCMIADEDARNKPNQLIIYFTAFAVDINEIVLPLFEIIHRWCPEDLRPVYKGSHQGKRPGLYYQNGSCVRLVGVDKNPNGLRGRGFEKGIGSECGFIEKLKKTVKSVLEPQMLGRAGSMLLNSTPPEVPGHFWDTDIVPDAYDRKAYSKKTIDDNPLISIYEKELELESKGGRDDPDVQREYFGIRSRPEETVVIPEWDEAKHVRAFAQPDFAHCYTVFDPGVDDLCGIGFFVYSYLEDRIYLVRDWAKRNANTGEVADVIKQTEAELWGALAPKPLQYYGPKGLVQNPYQRISDVDKRLILDLNSMHGIRCSPSRKDDKLAALHGLRNLIKQGKFVVDPACKVSIAHLRNAIWNKSRTSYTRTDAYGHFDMVDVCVYAARAISRGMDPSPPEGQRMIMAAVAKGEPVPALSVRAETSKQHKGREVLERAFGGRRRALFGGRGRR